MSTSQGVKQSEGASGSRWSSFEEEESSTKGSTSESESSTRNPPIEPAQANPPPPKIRSFIGKEVVVPTTQDQVQAILPTSGAQFEILANLVKDRLVSQDQPLNTGPRKETPQGINNKAKIQGKEVMKGWPNRSVRKGKGDPGRSVVEGDLRRDMGESVNIQDMGKPL